MRTLRTWLAALLPVISFSYVQAQSPEAILDSLRAGRKPEKLFTHFDKSFYKPGETIWFKTYLTVDGVPGNNSTAARVDLLDETGTIIGTRILPAVIGTISGSIELPSTLAYNTYVFRLCTQQMLNTGSEEYHYKLIPVLPSASSLTINQAAADKSIQFFAESGTFLADELNVLAFKAVDERGRPTSLSGVIKDSKGTTVVNFATEVNGMGRIEIKPAKNERYTAEFADPSGKLRNTPLPEVIAEGTNLLVLDEVFKKRLIVNSRNASAMPAYILGEMDQTMVFKIDISQSNGHYMGRVPLQDLPGGLLHIGVFTSNHTLLTERTCFVNSRHDTTALTMDAVVTSLAKRAENEFEFQLPDSMEAVFSVAATELATTNLPIHNENILTATLITGNVKGVVNPLYEFGAITGDVKNDAVDLLLLTQEYKWNWPRLRQLAAVKLPQYPDNYIPLRGIASSDRTNKFLPETDLRFIIQTKDSATNFFSATTDSKGYFEVPGMFFEDSASLYVQSSANRDRDKKVQLEILSPSLSDKYTLPKKALPPGLIPAFMKVPPGLKSTASASSSSNNFDFDTTGKIMQEIVIQSKVKASAQVEKRYTRGLFSTTARQSIDFVNNKPTYAGGNIFDYIKGRYSYVQVFGNYPNYSAVFRNMMSLGTGSYIPMALYLDEFPANATQLISIPMMDIALVRIYGPGVVSSSGAIVVYTKKGDDLATSSTYSHMTPFAMAGFSKAGMFLSPDYTKTASNSIKNDKRSTLYWDATLNYVPEDGKLPIRFFNSDECKEYKIVLQGFSTNGKMFYWEKVVR